MPSSVGLRGAPHIPLDLPCEEETRVLQRLHALSALPAPRGGALRVTHPHPEPPPRELGRLLAALLSFLHRRLPTPPLPGPRASPPPSPAPRPGLSRTSLRSWRPHVFTRLSALVDVVSHSDFQARPQLRRQHRPGPSRAPRRCAQRRHRARPPPLSRPPRPRPTQPQPTAQRAQPCHPLHKAAAAAPTSASGGAGGRRGGCRHPSPFLRRRRQELWPPPPARPRRPEQPQD